MVPPFCLAYFFYWGISVAFFGGLQTCFVKCILPGRDLHSFQFTLMVATQLGQHGVPAQLVVVHQMQCTQEVVHVPTLGHWTMDWTARSKHLVVQLRSSHVEELVAQVLNVLHFFLLCFFFNFEKVFLNFVNQGIGDLRECTSHLEMNTNYRQLFDVVRPFWFVNNCCNDFHLEMNQNCFG